MTKKHTNIDSMTSLLTDRQVAIILSTSRATIWRRVTDRTLPQPVKIGHATRWLRSEIEAVIAAAVADRDQGLSELVDVVDRACAGRDGELAESADVSLIDGEAK